MQVDLFRSIRDLDLGWPEVKVTKWPFLVTKYMSRSALTRERRWWKHQCSISNSEEVIDEKIDEIDVPENGTFFVWPDLEGQRLTQIGQLAHHWIRNIPSYPLVFVANSRSSITLRSEMARGVAPPPPPRCVLVWWKRRCGRGLRAFKDGISICRMNIALVRFDVSRKILTQ